MSLLCGNCRELIYEGFGLLCRLERDTAGKFKTPDENYFPPNAAACDRCWTLMPEEFRLSGAAAKTAAEKCTGAVYVYVPADSNNDRFWKAKTWSGIVTNDDPDAMVYLPTATVVQLFSKAIEIIDGKPVDPDSDDRFFITDEAREALIREVGSEETDRMIRTLSGRLH